MCVLVCVREREKERHRSAIIMQIHSLNSCTGHKRKTSWLFLKSLDADFSIDKSSDGRCHAVNPSWLFLVSFLFRWYFVDFHCIDYPALAAPPNRINHWIHSTIEKSKKNSLDLCDGILHEKCISCFGHLRRAYIFDGKKPEIEWWVSQILAWERERRHRLIDSNDEMEFSVKMDRPRNLTCKC